MKSLGKVGAGFVAALLVSTFAASSQAAINAGENRLSLNLGGAFPTAANDFNDTAKNGLLLGAQYLRQVGTHIGVGARVNHFNFPGEQRIISLPLGRLEADSDATATTIEAIGRYSFHVDRKAVPFLTAGVGMTMFDQETSAMPLSGSTWADTSTRETRTLADDSSSGFALSFGGGVEFEVGAHMVAGLEATWHMFGVDGDEFGTDTLNVPSASLHAGWKF